MVLETHVKLCVKKPDFLGKKDLPQKSKRIGQNWSKNMVS